MKLRPPGAAHASRFGEAGAHCLTIDLEVAWLKGLGISIEQLWGRPANLEVPTLTLWFRRRIIDELDEPDDLSRLVVEGIVVQLLATLARHVSRREHQRAPRWLLEAREQIQDSYLERVGLSRLAARAGVHPVHLASVFRRHYGCSVGAYVQELRLERACALLANSDIPLVRLALELGFSSQSHFTRVFSRAIGETPAKYRFRRAP